MFRLYDSTRREICMAAFIGLCLLPTLGVCAWAIARRLPWDRANEEARLSTELGVAVSVESIAHTVPGVVRYTGLKLTDPETGLALLRCDELEATWTSMTDSQGQIRPAVEIAARNVESAAAAWPRLKEVLCRSLECQNGQPEVEVRATADAWKVHNGGESNLLEGVTGGIGVNRQPSGFQAQMEFRLAHGRLKTLVRMRLLRDRHAFPPAYRYDLETDSGDVPQSIAALIRACGQPTRRRVPPGNRPESWRTARNRTRRSSDFIFSSGHA